jgi:peptide/nickel transport system permease protein
MTRALITRCAEALIALFLMSAAIFALGRVTGDPVALLLSDSATEADRMALTANLGLDQPLLTQYVIFLRDALHGDLGRSLIGDRQPALDLVLSRLGYSLQLAGVALVFSFLIGIPLGVMSAVHRGRFIDFAARLLALIGQSVPVFWLGIVLIFLFSVTLGLLPTSGYGDWRHFIMPALTLGLFTLAAITRLCRASMLEALNSEYVKFARIKGVSENQILIKHALRNSLMPVVTFMGTFFAAMITGAVVVETVFSWPGIGRLAYESILRRDFPVVQATVLTMTLLFISCNLAVDLIYLWLDPRMRQGAK